MSLADHDPRRGPTRVPPARDGRTLPIAACTLQNRSKIVPLGLTIRTATGQRTRCGAHRALAPSGHHRAGDPAGE